MLAPTVVVMSGGNCEVAKIRNCDKKEEGKELLFPLMAADDEEEGERGKGLTDVDQIGVDEGGELKRGENVSFPDKR